jgi:hypothetical protein
MPYVHKEHNNRVDRHKCGNSIDRVTEPGLRENTVVQRKDAGFDEEQ